MSTLDQAKRFTRLYVESIENGMTKVKRKKWRKFVFINVFRGMFEGRVNDYGDNYSHIRMRIADEKDPLSISRMSPEEVEKL